MSIKPTATLSAILRPDLLAAVQASPIGFEPTWSRIFVPAEVSGEAGVIGVEDQEGGDNVDPGQGIESVDDGEAPEITVRPYSIPFRTRFKHIKARYSDTKRATFGSMFAYETSLARKCFRRMQIHNERFCYNAIFNQTTFPADNVSGMNAGTAWTNSAATPINDVEKMLNQLLLAGADINACVGVCSYETFKLLLNHPQLVNRRVNVQVVDNRTTEANRLAVAAQLGLKDVIVTTLTRNTASEGASRSMASVAGKNFFGVFQPPVTTDPDEYCFGRTYYNVGFDGSHVGLGQADQYYDVGKRATFYRYAQDLIMQINFSGLFKLIGNVNP